MISRLFTCALFAVSSLLVVVAPANAAGYTLNCTDAWTGEAVTVDVDADSRSAAIEKTKNDPAYADYDDCS